MTSDPAGNRPVKTIIFLADAGSGHRMTAECLKTYIPPDRRAGIEFVNPYREILSKARFPFGRASMMGEALYNLLLARLKRPGPAWRQLATVFIKTMRARRPMMEAVIGRYLDETKPDLVIVLIPLIGDVIAQEADRRGIACLMIVTDQEEVHPDTWVARDVWHLAAFSQQVIDRGLEIGARRTTRLSGPILRPVFFERHPALAAERMQALGLSPDLPTLLIFFGGFGSPKMIDIARALDRLDTPVQVVFACGRADRVRSKLEALPTGYDKRVLGFEPRIDLLMEASTLMIAKPGPGVSWEAAAKGLPVLLELNETTLPQEEPVARAIEAAGYGRTFAGMDDLVAIVDEELSRPGGAGTTPAVPFRSDLETIEMLREVYRDLDGMRQVALGDGGHAGEAGRTAAE